MPLNPSPKSDVQTGIDELEEDRTIGLTRMQAADFGKEKPSERNEVPWEGDPASSDEASEQTRSERAGIDGLTLSIKESDGYDATRDARTGRPPNPLEAQRLAKESQTKQSDGDFEEDETEFDDDPADDNGSENPSASEAQTPARMVPPKASDDEAAAVGALVKEGISREHAEELVEQHGVNWESLKAAAFPSTLKGET